MAYKEAQVFEKRAVSLLSAKWGRRYSEMVGLVHSRMAMAVVRSNTLILCRARAGRALRPLIMDGTAFETIR